MLSDIFTAIDSGNLSLLALLDLSAAFDTVDHDILLHRLHTSFGLSSTVYTWFQSYLTSRTQSVRCGTNASSTSVMTCGVPQGSVLGPILFLLYTSDVEEIIKRFDLECHMYADDTQTYGHCRPPAATALHDNIERCIEEVAA